MLESASITIAIRTKACSPRLRVIRVVWGFFLNRISANEKSTNLRRARASVMSVTTSSIEHIIDHQAVQARQQGFHIDEVVSDQRLLSVSSRQFERPGGPGCKTCFAPAMPFRSIDSRSYSRSAKSWYRLRSKTDASAFR